MKNAGSIAAPGVLHAHMLRADPPWGSVPGNLIFLELVLQEALGDIQHLGGLHLHRNNFV